MFAKNSNTLAMKKTLIALLFISFFTKSCFQEPFDTTLLDQKYWSYFSESVELVAFDKLGVAGSYGFYRDSDANHYVYTTDVYDSTYSQRLFFIHYRQNEFITHSQFDTTEFAYSDVRSKIEWVVDSTGIIQSSKQYNWHGELISTEEYDIYQLNDSLSTIYQHLMIKEKKKYNSNGVLLQHLIYDEKGNYTIQ